jgi:hypothetical protein
VQKPPKPHSSFVMLFVSSPAIAHLAQPLVIRVSNQPRPDRRSAAGLLE